jgi:hypothetical protein
MTDQTKAKARMEAPPVSFLWVRGSQGKIRLVSGEKDGSNALAGGASPVPAPSSKKGILPLV